ncbi:uncharacterized protein LOC127278600 [Leptopilina boulardi]|uniref:uncharacterized protein LOC127278600 n=1 Tax=Leptopilina boulardi TaxID=63433 RepID=UPI0021F66189|nr:uncharacterized protein LOC127278600 [Leptopilina boulardi]
MISKKELTKTTIGDSENSLDENKMEFTHNNIVKNVNNLKLPNKKWSSVICLSNRIMFFKIEKDFESYLSVSLTSDLIMNAYYHCKIINWMECDKVQAEKDIEDFLQIFDKVFRSGTMYMDDR